MDNMGIRAAKKKNPAAVTLGRQGGENGGPARAAKLTPEQRSENTRKAVQARWAKAKEGSDYMVVKRAKMKKFSESRRQINEAAATAAVTNTSDHAVLTLLKRLKATSDPTEVRQLSDQLERVIFHKQFKSA